MEPSRLQEIIKPLETLLVQHGFKIDGEPMVEGAVRMASFIRSDGSKHVDYTIEVTNDLLKDWSCGWAEYKLMVHLYGVGDPIELCKISYGTNVSTTTSVNDVVQNEIKPKLEKYL
jgi:hypothetical protein